MSERLIFVLWLLFAVGYGFPVVHGGEPRDLYVSVEATPVAPWSSWSSAFTNIQDAFDQAEDADTIHLAGHTFALTEQLTFNARQDVVLRGGYAATNDFDRPGISDPERYPTIIQRSVADRFRLLTISGATNLVIENIAFIGGYPVDIERGGGLYIDNSVVLLFGCEIKNNQVLGNNVHGGGLYALNDSRVRIDNCRIVNNQALNNHWSSQTTHGGGLFFVNGVSEIRNTIIQGNQTRKTTNPQFNDRGGGIGYRQGQHHIHNSAITGNTATGHGGGIWVEDAATLLVLENVTLSANTGGYALTVNGGTVAVTNSILWHNQGDIDGVVELGYSNTDDGYDNGQNGNISINPMFERGLYLAADSGSVNSGTGTPADWGLNGATTRYDGEPDTGNVDQGYHFSSGMDLDRADYFVSGDGNDINSGTHWDNPFRTITHAFTQAVDGTRIHIAPGLYTNGINGGEQFPLSIADRWGIQLLGAGAYNTTLLVTNDLRERILDLKSAVGDTLISGMTLEGGYPEDSEVGGGMRVMYGSITVDHCVFTGNRSHSTSASGGRGGAIYASEALLTVFRSRFEHNLATSGRGGGGGRADGGGLYAWRGRVKVEGSMFVGNSAYKTREENNQSSGGGIHLNGGQHLFFSSLIASNISAGEGAAVYSAGADLNLVNLTIADNDGISVLWGDGGVAVTNSILWGNTGADYSNLVHEAFSHSCAAGLVHGAQGNIVTDPLFVDAPAGDYRLRTGFGRPAPEGGWVHDPQTSPAIDAGINLPSMPPAYDLDGLPRVARGDFANNRKLVDIGAYESHPRPRGSVLLIK